VVHLNGTEVHFGARDSSGRFKKGIRASKHREHTTAVAENEPVVGCRTNAEAALIPPARPTRDELSEPLAYLDCYCILTSERTRMFGLVAKFLSSSKSASFHRS
jgi:hypothetical protein